MRRRKYENTITWRLIPYCSSWLITFTVMNNYDEEIFRSLHILCGVVLSLWSRTDSDGLVLYFANVTMASLVGVLKDDTEFEFKWCLVKAINLSVWICARIAATTVHTHTHTHACVDCTLVCVWNCYASGEMNVHTYGSTTHICTQGIV